MDRKYLIVCLLFAFLMTEASGPLWSFGSNWETFVFPDVGGWKQMGEIQTFTPKTLYEYINGAADLYLTYNFEALRVAEYQNEKKSSVTVDVYRHKTPIHAFGIYSQERLPDSNFVDIGAQGYVETNVLNFVAGPYYVKISSYNTRAEDKEILLNFAKKVSENFQEKGALPSVLSSFPEEGKRKNSEKFVAMKFLGYAFLHSAFTADYELSGAKFKLFVIEGVDRNDCKEMIKKYLQQTGSPAKDAGEGRYTLSDRYNGNVDLYWKGRNIWGILNAGDASLRSRYLELFKKELQKRK